MSLSTEMKQPKPHVQFLDAMTGLITMIGSMVNRLEALELQQNANHISFLNRLQQIEDRLALVESAID